MPEISEDYVRIPVRECKITATIDISKKDGIKALYCGDDKQVATYLFDKKDWTMDKAKEWVADHNPKESAELSPLDKFKEMVQSQPQKAAAYLSPGGFAGKKVDLPVEEIPMLKMLIREAYRKNGSADDDIPKWVKETLMRDYIHESIEIPLAEVTAENIAKGILPIRILQPGFNATKGRHYGVNAVSDTKKIFEGAKQYANHATKTEEKERPERDIRDWVSTVENVHVSPKDGCSYGNARIHAGWFKDMVQGLYEAGTLNKLGVSINSVGKGSRQKIDGVETFAVEGLIDYPFKSVDFVTEAGAGGQAGLHESVQIVDAYLMDLTKLKETRPDLIKEIETEIKAEYDNKNKVEVKKTMETNEALDKLTKDNEALVKESAELKAKIAEEKKGKAKIEAQAAIKEAVNKSTLPEVAKAKLIEQFKEAEKADGVDVAIKTESDYLAKLTEAGKVKGLGVSQSDSDASIKALKESAKRSHPEWTEAQINTFVTGR